MEDKLDWIEYIRELDKLGKDRITWNEYLNELNNNSGINEDGIVSVNWDNYWKSVSDKANQDITHNCENL